MTNGTSQGLYILVAIIIFGIFVLMAYLLFSDKLSLGLTEIFDDSVSNVRRIYKEGKDIEGVSTIDINDEDLIIQDNQSKNIQIRQGSGEVSDVWIKIEQNDSGTYSIIDSGTDEQANNSSEIRNGSIEMPNSVLGKPITRIANGVFEHATFQGGLKLPRDLAYVGERAFRASVFTGNLVLPTEMWGIQMDAFRYSIFTGEFKAPKGLRILGSNSFQNSGFTGQFKIPDSVTNINEGTFQRSRFTGELNLPKNLTRLSHYAFSDSMFTGDLILPDSLTSFGGQVFNHSNFSGRFHISNNLEELQVNNFNVGNLINSDFLYVTGGQSLERVRKIEGDNDDLTNAKGFLVRGVEYKTLEEVLSILE